MNGTSERQARRKLPVGKGVLEVDGRPVEAFAGAFVADWAIAERSDDDCAAAFAYCREPQAVRRHPPDEATPKIGRFPYEQTSPVGGGLDFVRAAIDGEQASAPTPPSLSPTSSRAPRPGSCGAEACRA